MGNEKEKHVSILGIRGIPASHGGFETFAEYFAPYLVEKGWKVTVYCQETGGGKPYTSEWNGVHLFHIPVAKEGSLGSIIFDWKSVWHARKSSGVMLTLGYNTAIFSIVFRLWGKKNIMNMDGIEWKRAKWPRLIRWWFYINEVMGSFLANHLVADHPEIKNHLNRNVADSKITVIPYAAPDLEDGHLDYIEQYNLQADQYALIVARPEPENSILEVVRAFCSRDRKIKLVILGNYDATNDYHNSVMQAANESVVFLGAIYDQAIVQSLRFFALFYIHGHQVGGTNPSLVESLGAGSAILAHDNKYNRWVAGEKSLYFQNIKDCDEIISAFESKEIDLIGMRSYTKKRKKELFTWDLVHGSYESLLNRWL